MAKYLVETYYTCTFKVNHYLDDINETELKNLEKRDDGKFEVLDVKLDNRKTKNLDPNNNKILDSKFLNKLKNNNTINFDFISDISNYIGFNYEKNSNKKIILDKSPFNFFWLGFIKLIFPQAKILHIIRNQEDTCLSIYKSLFGKTGVLWSYDKNNIIKFVKIYNSIIKFWVNKIKFR